MKKHNDQVKPKTFWHALSKEDVLKQIGATEKGLSSQQAQQKLAETGENILPKKKPKSIFLMFLEELINPIVLILLIAMAFSFIVNEVLDGCVVLGIVMIDAIIGTIQSKRAQRVANSLSNMIKVKAKVLRDGEKIEVESNKLTIGDIVYLESGDKISADMRILSCSNFTVDEALLTGESINAVKDDVVLEEKCPLGDRKNMVFSGSSVITGRAVCVVVEIGKNTEIGNIATNLNEVKEQKSPLNIRISKFSKQISIAIVAVAVVIFIIMTLQHYKFNEVFISVIALAVSAMPEGLPLAVTMALTIASNRMGKNKVVVKNLNAVESLGSCTVIATDKTGTLTLNEQTAKIIALPDEREFAIGGSGYNTNGKLECKDKQKLPLIKHLALMGELNNEAKFKEKDGKAEYFGDSIDIAFKVMAKKIGVNKRGYKTLSQIPYESENKYSALFYENDGKKYCTIKGSLEKVLEFSSFMNIDGHTKVLDKKTFIKQNESLAQRGYRVIALASGEIHGDGFTENNIKNLTILGLVGFIDPVRQESKQAIADCHKAGIKVIMITGDHPLTALSIAKDIDIAQNASQVVTGKEVEEYFAKGEKDFDDFVKDKTVFSRVTPTDKLHIVESLKRQGEFVAVTGDGVNDSPAIKSAHIGIAMGSGTDVSKETADMIILDDNFNSIVKGVKEGRTAYSNIRKIAYFLLSGSLAEVLFFLLALVCGSKEPPLLPIQLLWLNIVTDGFQDLALSFEKAEPNIMCEKPRSTKESLFSKSMVLQVGVMGCAIGLIVFGCWMYLINVLGWNVAIVRSLVMTLMVFLQNWHAFNCRSEKRSIFKINPFSNWFFAVSTLGSIGIQILFMEVDTLSHLLKLEPIQYTTLLILIAISLTAFVICELYKLIIRSCEKRKIKNPLVS
ncbi:MAG: HAD-IC family P-type ATPase [Clostridia bacterium]|nr:HAD-IC family P-type ATPase [Clostridia bacterium]